MVLPRRCVGRGDNHDNGSISFLISDKLSIIRNKFTLKFTSSKIHTISTVTKDVFYL